MTTTTVLGKLPFQLWVFVVIVALGSICIIATVAIVIRCCVLRKRAKKGLDKEFGPTRRVTVRRGRIVPASHYLSLTGSRFGMNQFEDNETVKTGRRSPFDFWSGNRREKSVDEMTDISSFRAKSPSASTALYSRNDYSQSTQSLDKQITTTILEVDEPDEPSPTLKPSRNTSFSRPFARTPTSPFPHSRNLSMIEEASPHTSMISTKSTRQSSAAPLVDSNFPRPDMKSTPSTRRSSNNHTASMMSGLQVNADAPRSSALTTSTTASLRGFPTPPTNVPMPIAYRGSRSSLGEHEVPRPSLSHRSSLSRHDSTLDQYDYNMRSSTSAEHPSHGYWGARQDLKPISRSASKKGNVLRKKSLRNQEFLSGMAA